ncbi:hypothetical protein D1O33_26390 (plasmid) [Rhodococcus rhodochrous]|uniref:hypothetical protein n=1 Tax=Rhodococcus rhodochrous TaxID=1829 RepID=UPI00132EFC0F|nr:hypothetical protein [Rhodococcus rhodochrous]QHG85522.1 hypothetical protein D1O33_26390 [Rhodococcus rhodochrous]
MTVIEVEILAASNAADRGLRALADLAAAAAGSNYRVVGGHMVHLLGRLYPTDTAARVTADADAGMETVAATDATFHTALLARGYRLVTGNHYEAPSGDGTPLSVDLLVPGTGGRRLERVEYAGRGFDAIPGLTLALASDPVQVRVRARLTTTEILRFEAPVPGVEQAVVLKAFAWRSRLSAKDIADLCTLLTITHEHRDRLSDWKLHTARTGARKDAARALHELVAMLDRGQRIDGLIIAPARLAGLIRRYVADPHATRPPADPGTKQVSRDPGGQEALLSALRAAVSGHPPRPKPGAPGGSTTPFQPEPPDHSAQADPDLEL